MDDLAEQFSGMIKRNLNPIRHSRGKRGYLVHMLSNAKSFEVHNLKSGYLKKIRNGKFTFVPFSNDLQVAPINVL
jgi:hypothetical protein